MGEHLFRFPRDDEHVAILGRNGSGKTQFAVWMLAERSWDRMPWIIINSKGDDLIDSIPNTREVSLTGSIPSSPGIYVMRPILASKDDLDDLNDFYRRVWQKQNVGIYADEGYMSTGLKWFRACLTQGRSRTIPMVVLGQRPVWLDRFVWSEASRFAAFDLNLRDDQKTADNMIPGYREINLKPFHCVWHDVKIDRTLILTPAPDRASILRRFRERARVQHKAL